MDAEVDDDGLLAAAMALAGRRVCVLGGAGVSTRSGIPDYRGDARRRAAPRQPLRIDAFVGSPAMRQRYWARAYRGWPRIRDAAPNAAHDAVTRLERAGRLAGLVTQNVDGLHQRAGASDVIELHGALRVVVCLACGDRTDRDDVQRRLESENGPLDRPLDRAGGGSDATGAAPDGDTDLDDEAVARFVVVACARCGGVLKPDVVFFGENVAAHVRIAAEDAVRRAEALLVIGTSLEVLSGRRLVAQAFASRTPVVVVNRGPTRADELATVRLDGDVTAILPSLLPQAR